MPLVTVGLLCGLGGLVSGWFAARMASRYTKGVRVSTLATGRVSVSLVCAVVSGLMGVRFAGQSVLASYLVLTAVLSALSWIDLATRRLPRQVTYPGIVVSSLLLTYAAWADGLWSHLLSALAGGLLAFGLMWVAWLASRGQLGGGDVRLAPLLGVNLGFLSLMAAPTGLMVGCVLGAIASLTGLASRRLTRSSHIPFGPFLALGTVLTLLWYG